RAQYLGADKAPIHLLHGVAPVEHTDRPGQPLVLRTPMAIMSLSVNGDGLEVRERHVRICLLVYVLEFAEWRRFEVEFHLVLDEPTNDLGVALYAGELLADLTSRVELPLR